MIHILPSARNGTPEHADILVIGGGVVGAAAALAGARGGARTALVERDSLATARGSSRGTARVYAPAAYPSEPYLEIALRALRRWRALEADAGERLLYRTGAVSVGRFAEQELAALEAAGVEAELVSPREVSRRFGVRLAGARPLLHQSDAGVIRADRALAVLLRLARDAGARLYDGESVDSIEERGEHLEVVTDRRTWRCAAAVVAAGPWNAKLLAEVGIDLPLAVSSQTVAYFALAKRSRRSVALMDFEGDEPYALWDPRRGLKAVFHRRGPQVDPDDPAPGPDLRALARLSRWVAETFPHADPVPSAAETCLYTNAPGEEFIVERHGRIVVAAACNGHGFQFAPETGARVAELAFEPERVAAQ